MKDAEAIANGLSDPSQRDIEKRARELALAAGRDQIAAADLAEARRQILGPSTSTAPVEDPRPE